MSGVSVAQGVAGRIKELRAARGWSAQSLADECARLGLTSLNRGTIAKIESLTKNGKLVAYEAVVKTGTKRSEIQVGPDGQKLAHPE